MQYHIMTEADALRVIPLYIEYYNGVEGTQWTEETAYRRIHQVITCEGAYCLLLEEDSGEAAGFVMGYFQQYDDLVAYYLAEIVIAHRLQGQGLGSALLTELERRVKALGAAMVQLESVNDAMHAHFYGKHNYGDVKNLVPKVKWL